MDLDPAEFTRRVNELVHQDTYLKKNAQAIAFHLGIVRNQDRRNQAILVSRRKASRRAFTNRIRPIKARMRQRIQLLESRVRERMEFEHRRLFLRESSVYNRANRFKQIRDFQKDAKYLLPKIKVTEQPQ